MTQRMGNTGREMVASGQWMKTGRKEYEHLSGVVIRYDSNRWAWEIIGRGGEAYTALWAARHYALKPLAGVLVEQVKQNKPLDRRTA